MLEREIIKKVRSVNIFFGNIAIPAV